MLTHKRSDLTHLARCRNQLLERINDDESMGRGSSAGLVGSGSRVKVPWQP
jgi:hypothetical protein